MQERWTVLAVLTLARTAIAFQFQSVAAVSPFLVERFQLSSAALGALIGLYLLPGVAVALPGGMLAQRFGDKPIVCFGLVAMAFGGVLMGLADNLTILMLGRTVSGVGAVVLNVLLTKMVTDWFEGRELAFALSIQITSWPLGIAIVLVVLPWLASAFWWQAAMYAPAAVSAAALALVAACYRPSETGQTKEPARFRIDLTRREFELVTLAGLVWTFYNVGFIVVLSFGPEFLVASGYSAPAASALVSTVSWVIIPALPLGAWLAGRIGRPDATLAASLLLATAAIWSVASLGPSVALFAAIGLLFGPPGGLIMALPGEAASPERRAVAMGFYFTSYYAGMGLLPALAGFARDVTGSGAAPLWFAGAMLIVAGLLLLQFRLRQSRPPRAAL